jgi:hypothetical protein
MAFIIEPSPGNRTVQLGAEELVRPMGFGNNWIKIRVGIRLMFDTITPAVGWKFHIGICSGKTDTYSSPNCVGWYGAYWPNLGFTPSYDAGGNYLYYSGGAAVAFTASRKIGAVVTDISASSGVQASFGGNSSVGYTFWCCDFFRSTGTSDGTNYGVRPNYTQYASTKISRDTFLRVMEDESFNSTFATGVQNTGNGIYSQNGLPLVMDTVSIVWNRSTPTVEIADLGVMRFY